MYLLFSSVVLLLLSCISSPLSGGAGNSGADAVWKGSPSVLPDVSDSLPQRPPAPPIEEDVFIQRVLADIPEGWGAVARSDSPWGIFHDIDKNGYPDYLLLLAESEESDLISRDILMDSRRLSLDPLPYRNFRLVIFYQYEEGIVLRYNINLRDQLILKDFHVQEIRTGRDFPYALAVVFQDLEGLREEWISLHGRGISRITLEQNLSRQSMVTDVDRDGYVDILVFQESFEEGSGYETFITWNRWDGKEFRPYKTTNVIRNLRSFFAKLEERLIPGGEWDGFVDCMDRGALDRFIEQGLKFPGLLDRFFTPLGEDILSREISLIEPVSILFPSILENPFGMQGEGEQKFSFIFKVQDRQGEFYFYQGIIGMSSNPFEEQQFLFLPH